MLNILFNMWMNTFLSGFRWSSRSITTVDTSFRLFIFAGFTGTLLGTFLAPSTTILFQKAIQRFEKSSSFISVIASAFTPKNIYKIVTHLRLPRWHSLKDISLKQLPKSFLLINICVTAIYTIGVLCSLLAGALLPESRATAIQLSGIVNGIATIMLATMVDPAGAQITDQVSQGLRSESQLKSVVFFLLMGRLIGTLILAQLLFYPFTQYIVFFTRLLVDIL